MDVYEYLQENKISYTKYRHPAVFTVAEAEKVTSHIPGLRTKNLFLRARPGVFYLICMPGALRLDLAWLKRHLKTKELTFGTPEELAAELMLAPGSVSPLAMMHAHTTTLLIHPDVWEAAEIGVHPNTNTATLVMTHAAFAAFCASLHARYEVLPRA